MSPNVTKYLAVARTHLAVLGTALGMLTLFASHTKANVLETAEVTVTPNCNTYNICVTGTRLNTPNAYVNYSFTLAGCGLTVTITGSIPVNPNDPAGDFGACQIMGLGQNYCPGGMLSGSATLFGNNGATQFNTVQIAFSTSTNCPPTPRSLCTAQSTICADFNGTAINPGSFIWFNANFQAQHVPASGATIYLTNSTISFTSNQQFTVPVPNAQITFSPNATCAITSYNQATNTWIETVPVSGSDEVFVFGLAFPVPAGFTQVTGQVCWTGTFSTDTPGVSIQGWKWGAAVYTCFTTDYNQLNVKPTHQNACGYNNGDHAGTPENKQFQSCVVGGARGGGGSNFTGSWSGTVSVTPACP